MPESREDHLPAGYEAFPAFVCLQIMAEEIIGAGLRFLGDVEQIHASFVEGASPLAPIAGRTGADQVVPPVLPAQVTWFDMVYG